MIYNLQVGEKFIWWRKGLKVVPRPTKRAPARVRVSATIDQERFCILCDLVPIPGNYSMQCDMSNIPLCPKVCITLEVLLCISTLTSGHESITMGMCI